MPLLTLPLALLGLFSVPALASIYLLRSRQRRQVVSSLMLWMAEREAREGGRRWQRIQTPLLFLLELLVLVLLTGAATDPRIEISQTDQPIVVVLDDSYSMRAAGAGGDTARQRAVEAVAGLLQDESGYTVRFVRAGAQPQLMGEAMRDASAARDVLNQWRCRASVSDLDSAITLARQLAGPRARVLVATDHAPPEAPPDASALPGRLRWWAFGEARANVAIVNAARSATADDNRVLMTVANLAPNATTATLTVNGQTQRISLDADSTHDLRLSVSDPSAPLRAQLEDDALDADNDVVLLPPPPRPITVQLAVDNETLRHHLQQAIRAASHASVTTDGGHLLLTDDPEAQPGGATWPVRFHVADETDAFLGPFVMDRAHPLTDGLALQGIVWAADSDVALPGRPVVTAGNTSLITDETLFDGRHALSINLQLDNATLHQSANWPVLIWNLVQWRRDALPGLRRVNARLGEPVTMTFADDVAQVTHIRPDDTRQAREVPASGELSLPADRLGVHEVQVGDATHEFAVNALSQRESDLRDATTGKWGQWRDEKMVRQRYASMAWMLLVPAVGLLALHAFLLSREGRGAR